MKRSIALVAFLFALLACDALALPRFAARTGAKCQSCHVDPSGGAMRQAFGLQYGREKLPVPAWSSDFELEDFTNVITNFLGVGADFRTLYFYQEYPDSSISNLNSFWQMQGDLYLNFHLAKKVNVFLKKGLYSGFEAYGLLHILPAKGHIKVGKFIPNFGTKIDDHTAFIRTYTGFSPQFGRPELTGAEVGIAPGQFSVVGGLYNATDGFGGSGGNKKAVLGRAEGIFELGEQVYLSAGGSIFAKEDNAGVKTTLYGGFGSFSYRNLTLSGEGDFIRTTQGAALTGTTVTGIVCYLEGNFLITPGMDVKVAYDFYDPDKDLASGAYSRISFGFEFFPIAGVEVRPLYRLTTKMQDPANVHSSELDLMLHFYL
jgi:hypothetical protein